MAYARGNPKTKKALRQLIADGNPPAIYSPGPFGVPADGIATVEGPHYPKPHRWYAEVEVRGGMIAKVNP